jgi:uncharacterized membrane protein
MTRQRGEFHMATLTVWKFDNWHEADQAVSTLEALAKQELIKVHDAATVSWQPEAKKPKTRQLRSLTGAGAMGGMFWGMLFGLIFLGAAARCCDRGGDRCVGGVAGRCGDR